MYFPHAESFKIPERLNTDIKYKDDFIFDLTSIPMSKTISKTIVAIGGGNIRTKGTASIDRETIRLSKKKHPRLLFIPTASSDSESYWKHIQEYFGDFLKC